MKKLIAAGCLILATNAYASLSTATSVLYGLQFVYTELIPKEITVRAYGSGPTQDDAINNALIQSVQKGLGVMVVSDLTVENERAIRNLAAMYSSGIVETYEVNSCVKTNEYVCDVTAVVLPWEFKRRIKPETIKGADLHASYFTAKNTLIQRKKMIDYYFSRIRDTGLDVRIRSVKVVPTTGDKAKLEIRYAVDWNRRFKNEFIEFLEKLQHDTKGDFDHNDVIVQWNGRDRVFLNTNDANTRFLIEKKLYEPIYVSFNELEVCEKINLEGSVMRFSARNEKIVEIDPNKLKNLTKITASIGCKGQ